MDKTIWDSWNKKLPNIEVSEEATRLVLKYDDTKSVKDREIAQKYIDSHPNDLLLKDLVIMQGILNTNKGENMVDKMMYCSGDLGEFTFKTPE